MKQLFLPESKCVSSKFMGLLQVEMFVPPDSCQLHWGCKLILKDDKWMTEEILKIFSAQDIQAQTFNALKYKLQVGNLLGDSEHWFVRGMSRSFWQALRTQSKAFHLDKQRDPRHLWHLGSSVQEIKFLSSLLSYCLLVFTAKLFYKYQPLLFDERKHPQAVPGEVRSHSTSFFFLLWIFNYCPSVPGRSCTCQSVGCTDLLLLESCGTLCYKIQDWREQHRKI